MTPRLLCARMIHQSTIYDPRVHLKCYCACVAFSRCKTTSLCDPRNPSPSTAPSGNASFSIANWCTVYESRDAQMAAAASLGEGSRPDTCLKIQIHILPLLLSPAPPKPSFTNRTGIFCTKLGPPFLRATPPPADSTHPQVFPLTQAD